MASECRPGLFKCFTGANTCVTETGVQGLQWQCVQLWLWLLKQINHQPDAGVLQPSASRETVSKSPAYNQRQSIYTTDHSSHTCCNWTVSHHSTCEAC